MGYESELEGVCREPVAGGDGRYDRDGCPVYEYWDQRCIDRTHIFALGILR